MQKRNISSIPDSLIYEVVEEQPVYYKNYESVLKGTKSEAEIVGSSYLQSWLITQLILIIGKLQGKYTILSNEVGLQLSPKTWRAADIAIFEKTQLQNKKIDNKYINIAPKVIIEIDTKASVETGKDAVGYIHEKTEALLGFGTEKFLWIFTESKKVMIAEKKQTDWKISGWNKKLELLPDLFVSLEELTKDLD